MGKLIYSRRHSNDKLVTSCILGGEKKNDYSSHKRRHRNSAKFGRLSGTQLVLVPGTPLPVNMDAQAGYRPQSVNMGAKAELCIAAAYGGYLLFFIFLHMGSNGSLRYRWAQKIALCLAYYTTFSVR